MADKQEKKAKETAGKKQAKESFKQEEKVLIIPLKKGARRSAKNKRMNRSVSEIRIFLAKHMRTDISNVSISQQLNESLWRKGMHNPPSSIKVKVSADEEGKVSASLMDEKERHKKESKRKLGLRQRLAMRRETAKTENSEEKQKESAPAPSSHHEHSSEKPKPAEERKAEPKKEEHAKRPEKKEPSQEPEQDILMEE